MVQWLKLRAFTAGDGALIPSRGIKIPHAMRYSRKKRTQAEFRSITERCQHKSRRWGARAVKGQYLVVKQLPVKEGASETRRFQEVITGVPVRKQCPSPGIRKGME